MPILESIRSFLMSCTYLKELSDLIGVDFLSQKKDSLSIEPTPAKTVLRTYVDGSSERQYVFVLSARLPYSDEIENNINNSGLFEQLEAWMEACTKADNLPVLGKGRTPTKIEALSSGYLYGIANNLTNARYQIQCRLIYDQEE